LHDYAALRWTFWADPIFCTVVDSYEIVLIHPRHEGCSRRLIGKRRKSNRPWIVGLKLSWLINDRGEVVDWSWKVAYECNNVFRPLEIGYYGEMIGLADPGFREKNAPPQYIKCCERGTWNELFTIDTNLS
jgi:hypothetical protein